jgi:hypothetical protein
MPLTLRDRLLFASVTLTYRGATVEVPDMLVDTGSATTLVDADFAESIGIIARHGDRIHNVHGVGGGAELVYSHRIDRVALDGHGVDGFVIEVGLIDYGFQLNGIVGVNFLLAAGAVIDLRHLTLTFAKD